MTDSELAASRSLLERAGIEMNSRPDLIFISEQVPEGASVLDLGCGDGLLLQWLHDTKDCSVFGVEIDEDEVIETIGRGIPVLCHDLDEGLEMFEDSSYDIVVLSSTLMQVKSPGKLMDEMLRIGKTIIVTYPNFAYWKIRCFLLLRGRMPVGSTIPYTWHQTPNIHHTTLKDFRDFTEEFGASILSESYLKHDSNGVLKEVSFAPNMRAETVITVIKSNR